MNILEMNNVTYSVYDGDKIKKILDGINLMIKEDQVTLISGPSGSGKTTLLYSICGILDNLDNGKIIFDGYSLYDKDQKYRDEFRLNNMGIVFQNYNLFPFMNVKENICFPIYAKGNKPDNCQIERMMYYLKMLDIIELLNKPVKNLSGGEQQRVSIVRALIDDPRLIVCDEPTSNLDSINSESFYNKIREIANKEKKTVVIVSHDSMAKGYCDRYYELNDGKIL